MPAWVANICAFAGVLGVILGLLFSALRITHTRRNRTRKAQITARLDWK
jgi:hypothetical protein